ncbi:MAG TPA: ANTAR domain-containing protein [Pseudomonas sp.]|nr:ANTAR domain-containing protein [Pseudomonas sp.]
MTYRLVQNFSRRRALLISSDERTIATLGTTLGKLGLQVCQLPLENDRIRLPAEALDPKRDVLFLDGDLPFPLDEEYCARTLPPAPLIGLVGMEAPSRLKLLMQAGATSFIRKPVHGSSVFSALYLGINEYGKIQFLLQRSEQHERKRPQRRALIKAILEVMRIQAVDDEEAYQWLRRTSMQNRMNIEDFSQQLIEDPRLFLPEQLIRKTS